MKEIKMDTQKSTSKTTQLNMMILRAWRERWSDSQWSINLKSVLPRGVSGDAYNLADCILQQSLVGPTANVSTMTYLRHSVNTQLVSHAAVMRYIAKYENFKRTNCVNTLLDFLIEILDVVTCRSKGEEITLPGAVVGLSNWLLKIFKYTLKLRELTTEKPSADVTLMLERSCIAIEKFVKNKFLLSILYVGRQEDTDSFNETCDMYANIKSSMANTNFKFPNPLTEQHLQKLALVDICHLEMHYLSESQQAIDKQPESISYCIQPILAVEILLNPSNDTTHYVCQLQMLKRIKRLSNTRLYYEIIRAGFTSLSSITETSHDTISGVFTFFKIPHIIKQLHATSFGLEQKPTSDHIPEVVDALELLLEDELLLDYIDAKCSFNIIENLLNDWVKQQLLNEIQVKHFVSLRSNTQMLLDTSEQSTNQVPSIINFINRAEVPLSGILKTLSADYNKVQEALVGVLCQVLVGNSFDLILSVATVEGRLKTFVSRLIQCNENSTVVPGDSAKTMTRSTLFDVSFLMLTFIVQTYGADVVLSENGESFFKKWVRECMVERNHPKSPRAIAALCNENIVDELLSNLNKPDGQLKNCNLTWQEICMNLPGVLFHVIIAWESDNLSSADVKNILDSIKRHLPTFSVCAASYLCAYLSSVREADLLKPLNMIQQFLTTTPTQQTTGDEMGTQDNIKERLGLSFQIIRKMQNDVNRANNPKGRTNVPLLNQSIVTDTPLFETFLDEWKALTELGWLTLHSAQTFESLLFAGGPSWLTLQLIEEILKCKYERDMMKAMDFVFGLMHLDIKRMTNKLLHDIIPYIIANRQGIDINEPQSFILARLCVFCIISSLEAQQGVSSLAAQLKRARSVHDIDDSDASRNAKLRKVVGNGGSSDTYSDNSSDFISSISEPVNNSPSNAVSQVAANVTGSTTTTSTAASGAALGNSSGSGSGALASQTNLLSNANNNGNAPTDGSDGGAFNVSAMASNLNADIVTLDESLQSSLHQLFKVFQRFVNTDQISPKIYFVYQFISLLVEYGDKERIGPVLRLLPLNLVQNLLRVMLTDDITVGLITRLYDLRTHNGRQAAISDLCCWRNMQLSKDFAVQV